MSSCTRFRADLRLARRLAVALVALGALAIPGTAARAAPTANPTVPLPDAAVLPVTGGQATVVVDVGSDARGVRPEWFSVTVGGRRQPTTVVPVMSDPLAVGIVVDTSAAGGAYLDAWASGATRFVLEAPTAARAAVIGDSTPPRVLAGLQQGPVDLVRTLSAVQAHGTRRTSDALSLAMRQLAAAPGAPHVIILYTTAADAGGETATHLADRLAAAHALLVVASTATTTEYWSAVTQRTGGFVAPAGDPTVVPALDQIATMLRSRYLVSFPAPARPSSATVRVTLQLATMATQVAVPDPDTPSAWSPARWWRPALWGLAAAGALALLLTALLRPR